MMYHFMSVSVMQAEELS